MTVKKLSVAFDPIVAERAAAAAEREGLSLSAWINAAAERALRIEDGLAAVAEYESEHGTLTDEQLAQADEVLDQFGIPRR
jgi:hypothetical protein